MSVNETEEKVKEICHNIEQKDKEKELQIKMTHISY